MKLKDTVYIGGGQVWTSGNDGASSGLDADTLDGNQATAFAAASHTHDDRYFTETEADARFLGISATAGLSYGLKSPNGNTVVDADAGFPSTGATMIHTLGRGPGGNDGHLLGFSWTGTTVYGAQMFLDTDPNDILAIRSRSNAGVWTDWKTVIHSGTIGAQSVNYAATAGDAGSVDGIDSSRIVYGDGSNGRSIHRTDGNANTSDSSNASGFYFGTRVTGMPSTDWWNWITVRGNSWSGNDGYHWQLAGSFWEDDFRIRRMQSGTNKPWVTLIHSGNVSSYANNYSLPAATASALGGIKVGTNLSIDANGVLSSTDTNTTYAAGSNLSLSSGTFNVSSTPSFTRVAATEQVSVNNRSALSVAHWSSTSATGAVVITLPGTHTGNWSMLVLRITTYEYNGNNHAVYYVSGHDWTSGWYNNGVTRIGTGKDLRLAYNNTTNKDAIILGDASSTWSYGHVTVDVVAHPSFYTSAMDITTGWDARLSTDLSQYGFSSVTNRQVLDSSNIGSYALTSLPSHNHDDRYYTETEVDTLLAGKQASGTYLTSLPSHNHDDRYYTESESDSRYLYKGSSFNSNYTRGGYGYWNGVAQTYWWKIATVRTANYYVDYNIRLDWTARYASGELLLHVHTDNDTFLDVFDDYVIVHTQDYGKSVAEFVWIKSDDSTLDIWVATPAWQEFDYMIKSTVTEGAPSVSYYAQGDVEPVTTAPAGTRFNQHKWDQAYDNYITGIAVTGGSTKTVTLTQRDGGTITTTFTDDDTNTTYSVGDGGLTEKNFTSALKTKLDGIAASANNYSLPVAGTAIGGVKSGTDISVDASGNVSVVNDSHTHDSRYYTETEVDTYFARGYPAYQRLDLNVVKAPGLYQYDGGISGTQPEGVDQANLRTIEIGSGARYTQMAFAWNSDKAWFRRQTNTTWTDWREFIHSGNIGSQSVNYAASAGAVAWGNVSGRPTALSSFTNDSGYITANGATGANGNFYIDDNYGYGIVGTYSATRYQGIWAMGDSYKLPGDGTGPGTLYGLAWTYNPDYGGAGNNAQAKAGLNHQMLLMMNGRTYTALGAGIWTDGTITTTGHGTSANWNTAYGWGNHASAGYQTSSGTVNYLNITGYGNGNFSFYQSSGAFAGYSGWANYFIGNHGDGRTYYNTVHIMPFWGPPKYSRLEGGTFRGPWTYWTEENFRPADYAAASHTHDDRYYTESEVDTKLATKAASSHTHDDRYYTETEINTLLNAKGDSIPVTENRNSVGNLASVDVDVDQGIMTFTTTGGSSYSVPLNRG